MLSSTIEHPLPTAIAGHLPLILLIVIILVVAFRAFRRRNRRDSATGPGDGHRDEGEE